MLRWHKPCESAEECSVDHMSGEINMLANHVPGPSHRGTSIPHERPPDHPLNKQPDEDDEDPSVSSASSATVPLSVMDPAGVLNVSCAPGPPSIPATNLYDNEITHDTDIHLGIHLDNINKGHFIQFLSSVKVCWMIQHSNCLLMHSSFTPFPMRNS